MGLLTHTHPNYHATEELVVHQNLKFRYSFNPYPTLFTVPPNSRRERDDLHKVGV